MKRYSPQVLSPQIQFQIKRSLEKRNSLRPITIKWINVQGFQCKKIIKENMCFCNHSYAQHEYHFAMQPYCKVKHCGCKCFQYIPHFDIKCLCKHSSKDHDKQTKKCKFCTKCTHFLSSWACKCGFKFHQHRTKIYEQWDQQAKILPSVEKKCFIKDHSLKLKENKSEVYEDYIYQSQRKSVKCEKPIFSETQQFRKRRLKQANERMFKILPQNKISNKNKDDSIEKCKIEVQALKRKPNWLIQSQMTPSRPLQLPNQYRRINLENLRNSQHLKNIKY